MKNLQKWCNQNSGFLAFWGIVIMIIVWLFPSINLKLPSLLNHLLKWLNYSISVPSYALLILLVLIYILFKGKIQNWNWFALKSATHKVIDIVSDENDEFLESPSYPNISKQVRVYSFKDLGHWGGYKQFPVLANSHWISHTEMITDDEAMNGGIYIFLKNFNLNYSITQIDSATLYMTIDDKCKVYVNDILIGEYSGLDELSTVRIEKGIFKRGSNKILFELTNVNSDGLRLSQYNPNIGSKGKLNPYGIKYLLRIVNK